MTQGIFAHLEKTPDDPILSLVAQYKNNTNPNKVDLSIGAYFNEQGQPENFAAVETAQLAIAQAFYQQNQAQAANLEPNYTDLVRSRISVSYLPGDGEPLYNHLVKELVFGKDNPHLGRIATLESVAGSGGLRLVADFVKQYTNIHTVHMSSPTWSNHFDIFEQTGLQTGSYPYYNPDLKGLDVEAMCAYLRTLDATHGIVVHACCHNPTGYDFLPHEWDQVLAAAKEAGCFVIFDMAYQGFGKGFAEDAYAARKASEMLDNFIVISSCSKNFGLYGERVGAVHVAAPTAQQAQNVVTLFTDLATNHYVAPGNNAAYIVTTILSNPELQAGWEKDLAAIRNRIVTIRTNFAAAMQARGFDFEFVTRQTGMFSFTGLTKEQVLRLRDEFAIYMVTNGRMNVLGINPLNIEYVADAFATVLRG